MRTRIACLLASLALTACNLPGVPVSQPSTKPKASTDVKPTGTAPSGTALQLLQKPAGSSTVLAGTLRIDAAYAYNTGAGKLITNDGAGLITNDGGSLITNDGGGLITNDGASLIGNDGAGLIGNDGASIVITNKLITNDGGGLITNDGAGIIAQGAGNLISKRKYQLAATTPSVKMAVGTLLRAANMEIQVIDMTTNKPLVLGQDAGNHDVLSIVTNAGGGFKVYLPSNLDTKNVRIQATAKGLADDHLTYQTLTPFKANEATAMDEDTALLARYLRGAFAARIEKVFKDAQKKGSFIALVGDKYPEALKSLIASVGAKVEQASQDAHADQYSDADRHVAALAAADAILGTMDLEAVRGAKPENGMLDELRAVLHTFRDQTGKTMRAVKPAPAADQGYFRDEQWMTYVNRTLPESASFRIVTPADLGEFVLQYVITNPQAVRQETLRDVFTSIGDTEAQADYDKVQDAMNGLLNAIFGALIPPEEGQDSLAMQRLLAAIKAGPKP